MSDVTREHRYSVTVTWRGNRGSGTSSYGAYAREHEIAADGKPAIAGSSDPLFRGDRTRWNPEELLVASLSACHQLWYLHLAADAGIVVTDYVDQAEGVMAERADVAGCFTAVVLRPIVTIAAGSDVARARELHHTAHEKCFIANSVDFPVTCEPSIVVAD
ncbi:MAG TPA: OsmC family protein [Xanthobacteraceae bacterium]|nr:OsmC family protein [Xanthobacteraceae bacterium]